MKQMTKILFLLASAAGSLVHAGEWKVTLIGGFVAEVTPSLSTSAKSEAFAYTVQGASIMTDESGHKWRVSINCVGFDEVGEGISTKGQGRCVWSGNEDDRLFVSVHTEGEGNRYEITGGVGQWEGASGEIHSRFTYLPGRQEQVFLGTDEGQGTLLLPKVPKPQ